MNKKEIVKILKESHAIVRKTNYEELAERIVQAAQKPEEWRAKGTYYIDVDELHVQAEHSSVFDEKTTNRFRNPYIATLAAKRNKINNAITSLVHEIQGDEIGLFMLHIYCGRLCLYSLVERDQTPSELIPVTMTEDTAIEIIKMYDNGSIKWVFED